MQVCGLLPIKMQNNKYNIGTHNKTIIIHN